MLISELFTLSTNEELLWEFLGNLNFIDKELFKSVQNAIKSQIKNPLSKNIGQNSSISEINDVKVVSKIQEIFTNDSTVMGYVISFDGVQTFLVLKINVSTDSWKTDYKYFWTLNWHNFFKNETLTSDHVAVVKKLVDGNLPNLAARQGIEGNLNKAIAALLSAKKSIDPKFTIAIKVIHTDTDRKKTRDDRLVNSPNNYSKIPKVSKLYTKAELQKEIPEIYLDTYVKWKKDNKIEDMPDNDMMYRAFRKRYEDHREKKDDKLKAELSNRLTSRLEKLKANKAVKAETPEEFFKLILEQGYLEKIRINDISYKLSTKVYFDFEELVKPSGSVWARDKNYITYKKDEHDNKTDEYDKFMDALWLKLREEFPGDENEQKRDEIYNSYSMPGEIKISLKLDKSGIVPDKMEFKFPEKKWTQK